MMYVEQQILEKSEDSSKRSAGVSSIYQGHIEYFFTFEILFSV